MAIRESGLKVISKCTPLTPLIVLVQENITSFRVSPKTLAYRQITWLQIGLQGQFVLYGAN